MNRFPLIIMLLSNTRMTIQPLLLSLVQCRPPVPLPNNNLRAAISGGSSTEYLFLSWKPGQLSIDHILEVSVVRILDLSHHQILLQKNWSQVLIYVQYFRNCSVETFAIINCFDVFFS